MLSGAGWTVRCWRLTVAALLAATCATAAFGCGSQGGGVPAGPDHVTRTVNYRADAGAGREQVLDLGGLVIRAGCTDYGQGRIFLNVAARSTVEGAARAAVLTKWQSGARRKARTYSFKSSDFDRDYGWYDFIGKNPYGTTGSLSFARPDSGQVAFTFVADQGVGGSDCTLQGTGFFAPAPSEHAGT